MDDDEWITRCAGRLHQHWPTIPVDDLRETATALALDETLRHQPPEGAATAWLRQGVLIA